MRTTDSRTWPEAWALPCLACDRLFPLRGIRADLTLMFMCPTHGYFGAASWTSERTWIDPRVDLPWQSDAATRQAFMAAALSLFLRSGVEDDYLILQSPVLDNFVQYTVIPGGDGALLGEVSSRQWPCPSCEMHPLGRKSEQVLFDMGFGPCVPRERNYTSERLPFDAGWLAAITEIVFRKAFDEPEDFGICAIFNRPAGAETFYLTWSSC